MARGRPRKWTPALTVSLGTPTVPQQQDRRISDIEDFLMFLKTNPELKENKSNALMRYGQCQVQAGMDPVAVANRIDVLRRLDLDNPQSLIDSIRLREFTTSLRKEKARRGGPKRKPLLTIDRLGVLLTPTGPTPRDLAYQVVWSVILMTGCRPMETHSMKVSVSELGIKVTFNGRKNDVVSSARPYYFPFVYSLKPPVEIINFLKSEKALPKIGSEKNIATCINSWIVSFSKRYDMVIETDLTSTTPRIRMDNLLRDLLAEGEITETVFEGMMGHSVETSERSYVR